METKIEIKFRAPDFDYAADFAIIKKEDGKRYIGRLTWEEIPNGGTIQEPTVRILEGNEFFQTLRGELRRLGYEENADKATVSALKYHLEDMRSLVFKGKSK